MPPNPKCIVCSSKPEVTIKIDTNRVTIKHFHDEVLIKSLNMVEPEVTINSTILISSEEGETECNNDKTLAEMGVVDGAILKADDYFQQYELSIIIIHKEPEREDALFEIIADPDTLKATSEPQPAVAADKPTGEDKQNGASATKKLRVEVKSDEDDDDDVTIIEEEGASTSNGNQQRADDSDDDVCIIDDDVYIVEDGAGPSSTSSLAPIEAKKRKTNDNLVEPSSKKAKTVTPLDDDDDDLVLIEDD